MAVISANVVVLVDFVVLVTVDVFILEIVVHLFYYHQLACHFSNRESIPHPHPFDVTSCAMFVSYPDL